MTMRESSEMKDLVDSTRIESPTVYDIEAYVKGEVFNNFHEAGTELDGYKILDALANWQGSELVIPNTGITLSYYGWELLENGCFNQIMAIKEEEFPKIDTQKEDLAIDRFNLRKSIIAKFLDQSYLNPENVSREIRKLKEYNPESKVFFESKVVP